MMLVSSSKMLLPPEDRNLVPCPRDVSDHCRGLEVVPRQSLLSIMGGLTVP